MALSLPSATEAQYHSIARGLGVLKDDGVGTSGVDFDVTAWTGRILVVTCADECLAAWFSETGQAITDTDSATAAAMPAGAQLTNGFVLLADTHETMLAPSCDAGEKVVLRVAAVTGTTTVRIERASV